MLVCTGEMIPGAGDTFKLREVPKARMTNQYVKACWGPVNSLRGVTLYEMLQWMIRSQAPKAPSEPWRRFRDLTEVVVVPRVLITFLQKVRVLLQLRLR